MAFHFGSPRLHKSTHHAHLYDILRNSRVYTTEGISSELHLSQGGKSHIHVKERSELHIRLQNSQLEIFVPRNKKKRHFCYSSKLSSRLLEWLMTDPDTNIPEKVEPNAVLTIQRVLSCTGSVLRDTLEEDGIRTGDIVDSDDFEGSEDDEEEDSVEAGEEDEGDVEDEHESAATTSESRSIRSIAQSRQGLSSSSQRASDAGRRPIEPEDDIEHAPRSSTFPPAQLPDESLEDPEHLELIRQSQFGDIIRHASRHGLERLVPGTATSSYPELLRRVVTAARRAQFPHKGIFNMSSMLTVLEGADGTELDSSYVRLPAWTGSRASSIFEHLREIGAAGELYVST